MQGTNAHLILAASATAAPGSALVTAGPGVPLQQQLSRQATRTWPLPPAHLIVASVTMPNRAKAIFSCQLDSPRLAFLHTHCVQQHPLLPTSALLEVAAAASSMLSSAGSMECLHGVVFAAPYVLTQQMRELTCGISLDTGTVEVQSSGSGSTSKRLHMAATAGCAAAVSVRQHTLSSSQQTGSILQELLSTEHEQLMSGVQQPLCAVGIAGLTDSSSCGGLLSSHSPSEGFLMHPAALEAALQMQAMRQQDHTSSSAELHLSAPATIRAYLLPAAETACKAGQELQIAAVLDLLQDATAAAAHHSSSMQLTSTGAMLASLVDAEFRPMQGAAAMPTVPTAAVTQQEVAAAAARSTGPAMDVEELSQLVQRTVEAVLGEVVDSNEPLMAAGLDSLGATEVRNSLQASLGLELPATLVSTGT